MNTIARGATALLLTMTATACVADSGEPASGESFHVEHDNTDIQVISVSALGGLYFELSDKFDRFACDYDRFAASSFSPPITHLARADCTTMVAGAFQTPLFNRYIQPDVGVALEADGSLSYANFPHTCHELSVTVAVKQLAYESESFRGIGFYAYDRLLNASTAHRHVFYDKDNPRLVRAGSAMLRRENGEPVLLFRFAGAGVCMYNGSGEAPWGSYMELKPYVSYFTPEGTVERWEAVEQNHRIYYNDSWDRSRDLLGL